MTQYPTRKMDVLGRIMIPVEFRYVLNWDTETKISVRMQDDQIILSACQKQCFLCGNENDLQPILDKHICQDCVRFIKDAGKPK